MNGRHPSSLALGWRPIFLLFVFRKGVRKMWMASLLRKLVAGAVADGSVNIFSHFGLQTLA